MTKLQGKKTYVVLAVSMATCVLDISGVSVPEPVYAILAGLLGATYKAGSNRIEHLLSGILKIEIEKKIERLEKGNG